MTTPQVIGDETTGNLTLIPRAGDPNPKASAWCGRPRKRGACRMPRAMVSAAPWYERIGRVGPDLQWELGGCKDHLTEAEKEFAFIAARLVDAEYAVLEYRRGEEVRALMSSRTVHEPLPPACWGWYNVDQMASERGYAVETPTDLAGLETWHQGKCAICGDRAALVRDHDHWSGLVRGMLCRTCNGNEGGHAGIFSLYRQRHPAMIFNLRIPY